MSSESQATTDAPALGECTYCEGTVSERQLAIQSYPEAEEATIDGLEAGGIALCPDCASEPVTLIESWTEHTQPPADANQPLGSGYRTVTDRCSFCEDDLDGESVLGVELFRRPGETVPAYANYSLCGHCQDVFEEFLENIRSAAE